MTHDKDKHDLALVEEECRVIYKHKNQCPMGDPFVKTRIILNLLCVLKNANKFCTSYKYFISINYLQMYSMKIPLSHVVQLDNNIPINRKISP
jgi:hypothetical protein